MKSPKKEKAQEIFNKFYFVQDEDGFHSMSKYRARECALIAVDEIMNVCPYIDEKIRENEDQLLAFNFQFVSYWQEVKEELIKIK